MSSGILIFILNDQSQGYQLGIHIIMCTGGEKRGEDIANDGAIFGVVKQTVFTAENK